jgi:hypothetical protein
MAVLVELRKAGASERLSSSGTTTTPDAHEAVAVSDVNAFTGIPADTSAAFMMPDSYVSTYVVCSKKFTPTLDAVLP